jgi:hypothetical protein
LAVEATETGPVEFFIVLGIGHRERFAPDNASPPAPFARDSSATAALRSGMAPIWIIQPSITPVEAVVTGSMP